MLAKTRLFDLLEMLALSSRGVLVEAHVLA